MGRRIATMPITPTELYDLRLRHEAGELPALHRRATTTSAHPAPAGPTSPKEGTR